MKTVFGKTNILLPYFAFDSGGFEKWSVIACDQHTSDASYWENLEKFVGDEPSTLGLILPEAYLGKERAAAKMEEIKKYPEKLAGVLKEYRDSLVYVERTLSSGMIRRGVVGAISLEAYDYEPGSAPAVRPTEGTVKERIPPRVEVRRNSVYEASHVMLFTEDVKLFDMLTSAKDSLPLLYDFDLPCGGGHITGRLVTGIVLSAAEKLIEEYEASRREKGLLTYGVGDGNHSLASAKAYYEELKSRGDDVSFAKDALVELVPISERAIVFEPIYKAVTGADFERLVAHIRESSKGGASKEVTAYFRDRRVSFALAVPEGAIVCGALQAAIDSYIKEYGGECDYIHGKDELASLAKDGAVCFEFDGIAKEELFPYVAKYGVLPRKAFSMGEACEKRYYTELRRLK